MPVVGDLREVQCLTEIDQIQHVFLETAATKTNTRLQIQCEFESDSVNLNQIV